ncbi:multidrug resistance protein, MATE family [Pseudooceanicola nitratireducens]|jgi:MATE family multidrug resistance protein|uniref:Multidrug-efflux transporter n=1 Tax=Pseudooceanicola nitratireducens TaxID=517719 RepID=A0A1I1NEB4_9RHOB|nr:MATE family efflux transporter [Pseudooceanicola nitratireducens]SEI71084.1 multidrug resistance protein, MATE family [Pseudooceanicola nitratireducens]SFC95887.1 multidrug resistance protein, MATE family [Pseudooceanicola nitratireducens]
MTNFRAYLPHIRALLTLGLPLIGSHVAQFAITLTDTIMLGWYDVTALAAQVLAGGFFFIIFITGSGFAWAVTPLVAEAEARGDTTQARRATRMALWLVGLYTVVMLPLMYFSQAIFLAIGQTEEVARQAGLYLAIAGLGLLPANIVMVFKSFLSALERTRIILWVTLAAVVANAGMNYLLIFGHLGLPEMGIRGAAVASVGTQIVSALLMIAYIQRRLPEHTMFQRFWRPDWEAFGRVFALGVPIGLTTLAEVGLFSGSSVMMGWLGEIPLAAHGIALQITSLTFMVHIGLSNAATVRAGRAMGARDWDSLRDGGLAAFALSLVAVVVTIVVLLTLPGPLIGLFLDPADPERGAVIALGIGMLAAAALFQLVDAAQVMAVGILRGVQETRVPMVIATISYWAIGMPVAYLLGFPLGLNGVGVWLGLATGLACAALALNWLFWRRTYPRLRASGC